MEDKSGPFDWPRKEDDSSFFENTFPTETRGDGKIRPNNARTGGNQGKASFKRKATCKMCGYLLDLNRDAHDGGTMDGNGAMRSVTKSTATSTVNGVTYTEPYGSQSQAKGGGCPLCGSRNGTTGQSARKDIPPSIRLKPGF